MKVVNTINMNKQEKKDNSAKQDKARELAQELFELDIKELDGMNEDQKKEWRAKYDMLSKKEFEYLHRKVLAAKINRQSKAGWLTLPRDFAIIVFCVVGSLVSLKTGLISGIATLLVFQSIFQVYYSPKLFQILGLSRIITYPAYFLLGYSLVQNGSEWWQTAIILGLTWFGSYLLNMIAAIPMQLYLRSRAESNPENVKKETPK